MTDNLDLPDFLKRDKSAPAIIRDNATVPAVRPDTEEEKWRVMEELRRDQRKAKTKARVAKMLAAKADRDAVAAGKVWNVTKARWE